MEAKPPAVDLDVMTTLVEDLAPETTQLLLEKFREDAALRLAAVWAGSAFAMPPTGL